MNEIKVKPMSVNVAWQGKKFKTPTYKIFESLCLFLLPKLIIPLGELKINFEFGLSYSGADIDNSIKPFLDNTTKEILIQ